jgi:hypothetical protein
MKPLEQMLVSKQMCRGENPVTESRFKIPTNTALIPQGGIVEETAVKLDKTRQEIKMIKGTPMRLFKTITVGTAIVIKIS